MAKMREFKLGGMRRVGCVHSCETCCLSMRVGGHVGGYISTAMTQIWWVRTWVQDCWAFDPISVLCTVGIFLPLSPMPMLGQDTRASSKLKMDTKALHVPGSDQNRAIVVFSTTLHTQCELRRRSAKTRSVFPRREVCILQRWPMYW